MLFIVLPKSMPFSAACLAPIRKMSSADLPVGCHAGLLARVRHIWDAGAASTAGLETGTPNS